MRTAFARASFGLVLLVAVGLAPVAGAAEALSRRELQKRLGATGRAEVTLRISNADPLGGAARVLYATLALEPPDRARLEIPSTGEKITLRADGGEWLQPRAKQLFRLRPEHGALALRWWRALLDPAEVWRERRLPDGRLRVVLPGNATADADSADLWLDARGLPSRLELAGGVGGSYRLTGWRFLKARGPVAFRLDAPAGFEVVELP